MSALTVDLITTVAAWDAIEAEWRELHAASPGAPPSLSWPWLREWWEVYGPVYGAGGQGMRILTARRGGKLAGALPIYVRKDAAWSPAARRLCFFSSGEAVGERADGQYLNLLSLAGEEQECADIFFAELASGSLAGEWDELVLSYVPDTSPIIGWQQKFPQHGMGLTSVLPIESFVANVGHDFETYLGSLGPAIRKRSRQLLRAVEQDGVACTIAATPATADRFFDELMDLHQKRWTAAGKRGCFVSERFIHFHCELIRRLTPTGEAVIGRLGTDSQPLALVYGLVASGMFHGYQSGMILDWPGQIVSPGTACHLLLMKALSERGVTRYNFGAWRVPYKTRLGHEVQHLTHFKIVRPTWRVKTRSAMAELTSRLRPAKTVPAALPEAST